MIIFVFLMKQEWFIILCGPRLICMIQVCAFRSGGHLIIADAGQVLLKQSPFGHFQLSTLFKLTEKLVFRQTAGITPIKPYSN